MHLVARGAATIAICLTAGTAFAKDPVPPGDGTFMEYSKVGDWTVWIDADRERCLIEKVFDDGAVVQMGLTENHKHGYLGVFTQDEVVIKNKQKIEIDIDGQIFDDKSRGIKAKKLVGNYHGGYILVDDPVLAEAVADGQTMTVFPAKTSAFQVDLTGTHDAMIEGIKCNQEQ